MGGNRAQRRARAKAQGRDPLPEEVADPAKIANAIGEVELAAEREEDTSGPVNEWTLSNGIKLKLRRVPPSLLADVAARLPQPKPPEFVVDETTGRTDTNPDDPAYKEALQEWAIETSAAAFSAAAVFGCSIIDLPEHIEPPESDVWIELVEDTLASIGEDLEIAREPKGKRFYHWLRYYAIDDDADLFALSRILTARTVITEREVHEMVARFRRLAVGFPDLVGTVTEWTGADRDQLQAALAGDDLGV